MKTEPPAGAAEKGGLPVLAFKNGKEWAAWLKKNHAGSKSVWLKLAKRATGNASVTYEEALQAALCYGWIDSYKAGLDGGSWLQRFGPRGPRSIWSKLNRERIGKLIAEGRMAPAGMDAVARAKAGGQWDAAYDSPKTAAIPAEFQVELAKSKAAAAFFATLDSANRYAILWRIQHAKKPETKARHIAKYIAMLKKKQKLHP